MSQRICVVGGGLTGLSTALILSELNLKIDLILPKKKLYTKDNRTTALSSNNYIFLKKFLNKKNDKLFWPSSQIDLFYETDNRNRHFMNFKNKEKNLMYVFNNSKLKNELLKIIKKNKKIKILNKLIKKADPDDTSIVINKKKLFYDIILICSGRNSQLNKGVAGRRMIFQNLKEIAHTTNVKHDLKINNARQYFLKEGPLAILPISKNKFSLVWTVCEKLSKNTIKNTINERLKIILGSNAVFSLSKVNSFPISFKFNRNQQNKNILFMGETSYNIHPVAGQGFNLILRDIRVLQNEFKNYLEFGMQLKSSSVIQKFTNVRKPENFLFGLGINVINKFFKHNNVLEPLKNIILKDINKNKFLKDLGLDLSNKGIY